MSPGRIYRGGQRGGQRGDQRGRRGSRGSSRGVSRGNDKLARSGIRTRAGYRKFDSQRIKEADASNSEDEQRASPEEAPESGADDNTDDSVADVSIVTPYNALLASLKPQVVQNGRAHKRRKLTDLEGELDPDVAPNILGPDSAHDSGEESEVEAAEEEQYEGVEDVDTDDDPSEAEIVEDDEDRSDSFERHFANPDDNELTSRLKSVQTKRWHHEQNEMPHNGITTISVPEAAKSMALQKQTVASVEDLPLKARLRVPASQHLKGFDIMEKAIAPHVFNYTDLLLACRTPRNAGGLRKLACLHAINHVLKGRDKVLKNNARLVQTPELECRDQGFTRPKILILLETRQMAAKYASAIQDLFAPDQVENKQRFKDAFEGESTRSADLPEDFVELFDGNNDNNFLTALKFTRKTLKFYSAFYASDIILASPLGLRRILENEDRKKRDHDFLSSIEVTIVDQADAMQMQSWENVDVVFRHLNLPLNEAHGCDFSRVRPYYLDGHIKHLRQTIVYSAYVTPEMMHLYNNHMLNVAGRAKVTSYYTGAITAASTSAPGIKQTFARFDATSPLADPDSRFKVFTSVVLPSLLRLPKPADGAPGILVFIPSYYDFLRVRNFFATSSLTANISFGAIHDYSDVSSQRRARSHFLSGRHAILLYTQRAHHFFRLKIRGVKRVAMYGLPDNPAFYEEIAGGYLETSTNEGRVNVREASVRVMFSKWDALRLERVVGSERIRSMLGRQGDMFDFV